MEENDLQQISTATTSYQMGYDANFQPELDKRYSCPVCLAALRDPVQTKCGHRFCRGCLKRVHGRCVHGRASSYRRCPVDNTVLDPTKEVFLDIAMGREVLSLTVRCDNFTRQCEWTGELRQLKLHMKECPEEDTECPIPGCRMIMRRSYLQAHCDNCPQRPVECQHCRGEIISANMTMHLVLECSLFPVNCVICGATGIMREDIPKHINPTDGDCPLVTVKCKFFEYGCFFQDKRKNIADHEKVALSDHMLLLTSRCAERDSLLVSTRAQLENLKDDLRDLYSMNQELKKCLTQHNSQQKTLLDDFRKRLEALKNASGCSFLWHVSVDDVCCTSPLFYAGSQGYRFKLFFKEGPDSLISITLDVEEIKDGHRLARSDSSPYSVSCDVLRRRLFSEEGDTFIGNITCEGISQRTAPPCTIGVIKDIEREQLFDDGDSINFPPQALGERYPLGGSIHLKVHITLLFPMDKKVTKDRE